MAINDILSGIAIRLGLKKSEEEILQEKIEGAEASNRRLYDKLDEHIAQIQQTEAVLRKIRKEYEQAGNTTKEAIAIKMRTMMDTLKKSKEDRELIARNIEKNNTLVHNLRIELEQLRHPVQTDEIEELTDDKKDFINDVKAEDKAVGKLNDTVYQPAENSAAVSGNMDYTALDKELDALLGESGDSAEQKTSDANKEQPLEKA